MVNKGVHKKAVISGAVGGAIEFYDFTLYGVLGVYFIKFFVPMHSPIWSAIIVNMVFFVGFIFRPLGAIIFGYIGDYFGRKQALFLSLSLMSFSMLAMGCLPTYESIGIVAPCCLLAMRILQGISAGGEFSGALVFVIEHSNKNNAGLAGGLVVSGCMGGLALGTLTGLICSLPGMPAWAWRVPFILGSIISVLGIYIRFRLAETPAFLSVRQRKTGLLRKGVVKNNINIIIPVIFIAGFNGIAIYVYFLFLSFFLTETMGVNLYAAKLYTFCGTVLLMFMLMLFGWLSDICGRTKLMVPGLLGTVILGGAIFSFMPHLTSALSIFILQAVFICFLGMYSGPLNTYIIELFNEEVRCRCSAIGYSIGMGVIGGSAPLVASLLSLSQMNTVLISIYILLGGLCSLYGLKYLEQYTKDYKKVPHKIPYRHSAGLLGKYF